MDVLRASQTSRELIRHTIGDEVFRRMQYDIDLAESRLFVD
ncbi:MAG: hypothetical protein ABSH03_15420 [Candidatus Lustribacter sp.]